MAIGLHAGQPIFGHRREPMSEANPFVFCTERRLIRLTGRRARTLQELLTHLREVGGASIFYHTHHQYLTHHFQRPIFYNDFALWAASSLLEGPLAERLAAIDMLELNTVRDLREATISVIESHIAGSRRRGRSSPRDRAFHFCQSQSFVMPTGRVAGDIREFAENLPCLTTTSIFYHFFEAHLRLGKRSNDFSEWLATAGHAALARKIGALNPYVLTLEQLKLRIMRMTNIHLGEAHGRRTVRV